MNQPINDSGLVFHQDPIEDLLRIFDAAFRIVVPGPGRRLLGLKSISEKQNGAPGWYLWFDDRPGAYLLELIDAGSREVQNDRPVLHRQPVIGLWRIKYYPGAEDPTALSLFSLTEQAYRQSDCFDATGTPDFARGDEIPDSFFQIGTIETGLSADSRGFVLRLNAPERWVTRLAGNLVATDEQGHLQCLRASGEKDRDIPAWEWAWFLMDRLVSALCLAYVSRPRQVALHDAPGHTFLIQSSGISQAVPDETIRQLGLSISFRLHDGHAAGKDSLLSLAEESSFLLEAPAGRCLISLFNEPATPHPWISTVWWHLRESRIDFSGVLPC